MELPTERHTQHTINRGQHRSTVGWVGTTQHSIGIARSSHSRRQWRSYCNRLSHGLSALSVVACRLSPRTCDRREEQQAVQVGYLGRHHKREVSANERVQSRHVACELRCGSVWCPLHRLYVSGRSNSIQEADRSCLGALVSLLLQVTCTARLLQQLLYDTEEQLRLKRPH